MPIAEKSHTFPGKYKTVVRIVPPWFIEWGFFASLFYENMAPILGIQIDRLGILFFGGLACICFLSFRERASDLFRILVFPIGFGVSYLMIQMMYHGLSIQDTYVKAFIPWIFNLIIIQALSFRTGFLHRFVIFALFMGSGVLFFSELRDWGGEGITRLGLDRDMGPLANSNALGAWFGFCTIYFFVLGVVIKRLKAKIVSWGIASGCLFVLALTVSRGALLATLIAIILGSREFLKRGFLPLFLLFVMVWILYGSGLFDQAISYYMIRGTEETGRFLVWPRALEGFLNAPLTGVGASNVGIYLPEKGKITTPHNGFLLVGMASGIFPLIFYAAYWSQAIVTAMSQMVRKFRDGSFYLPLVAFAFLYSFSGNLSFMMTWVIVTVAATMASSIPKRVGISKIIGGKR